MRRDRTITGRGMMNARAKIPTHTSTPTIVGIRERTPQAVKRTLAPGNQRSYSRQKQKEQADRHFDAQSNTVYRSFPSRSSAPP